MAPGLKARVRPGCDSAPARLSIHGSSSSISGRGSTRTRTRSSPSSCRLHTPVFGEKPPRAIGLLMETGDQNFRKKENPFLIWFLSRFGSRMVTLRGADELERCKQTWTC
ncbi:hypothetical protein D4764_18G0012610 [Takifugu flavidus]|uniref:Uncharacterized protein n=1 Tax=Takifugu flavidus TaxID=433684 RepID=A0A5C6NTX0_9TELE|nr:hypothetical protein D4764_18G0012610 [Takifugu flavidus]